MVSLIIYGVIAIALAAAAGYAFLTLNGTSQQTIQLQQNTIRLETATAALRATLLALNNDGVLFAPMGQAPTTTVPYTTLPAVLGAVGSTPWGQPFGYCPVANETIANSAETVGTVKSGAAGSDSYNVQLLSNASTQNVNYVVGYPANQTPANTINWPATGNSNGYVAFIISGIGPGSPMPRCRDITVSSTGVTVAGGSVRGVTAGFTYLQRTIASTDRLDIFVGPAATGSGTGEDVNNLTTLDNALLMWESLQPRQTRILLQNSQSYTTANTLNLASTAVQYPGGEHISLVFAPITENINWTAKPQITFTGGVTLNNDVTFYQIGIHTASSIVSNGHNLTFLQTNFYGNAPGAPVSTASGIGGSTGAPTASISITGGTLNTGWTTFSNVTFWFTNANAYISNADEIHGDSATNSGISLYNVNMVPLQSNIFINSSQGYLSWSYVGAAGDPPMIYAEDSQLTIRGNNSATISANNGMWFNVGSKFNLASPAGISLPQGGSIIAMANSTVMISNTVMIDGMNSNVPFGLTLQDSDLEVGGVLTVRHVTSGGIKLVNSSMGNDQLVYTGAFLNVPIGLPCVQEWGGGSAAGFEMVNNDLYANSVPATATRGTIFSATGLNGVEASSADGGAYGKPAALSIAAAGLTPPNISLNLTAQTALIDAASFEAAVRYVINTDMTDTMSRLAFLGTCAADQ